MSKIIEIAKGEIGVTEFPANTNKTKYGKWFGWDGQKWCGMFVSWVYDQAKVRMPKIGFSRPGFAGCQSAVAFFKAKGWITDTPVAGDLVFFDWNADGRYDHVGLYLHGQQGSFTSIEGNTSLTNDSNGGQVMMRTRKHGKGVLFVHIPNNS
jgi:cell wall-associated NlpC family hydrolase